jgi:hypothetical protein
MTRRRLLAPIIAIATFIALASGGAAAAMWIASASVSAGASSVTVGTTVAQTGNLTTTYRYAGTTSATVNGTLSIVNTGRAPLTYGLATAVTGNTTLAQKTALMLWTGTCSATPPAGAITTTLAQPAPPLPTGARTIQPGATVTVCVATRVTGDAAASNAALQGQSVTATFTVTGAVGANWKATASAPAITQSIYRIASSGAPSCTSNWWSGGVTLRWNAPANRVAGSAVAYRVFDTATGADVAAVTVDGASASVNLEVGAFERGTTRSLAVEAKDTFTGTTAAPSTPIAVSRNASWLLPSLSC